MIAMSRPLRFLFCASAAALIFGSEPSTLLVAQAQVADVGHTADLAAEAPFRERRATHVRRPADAPDRGVDSTPLARAPPDAGRRTDAPVVGSADRRAVESPHPMRSPKMGQRGGNVSDLRLRRQKRRGL